MRLAWTLALAALAAPPARAASSGSHKSEKEQLIGSVVRSERWSVRRSPHKVEELSGDVTYDRRDRFLRADWALYDQETEELEARGGVRAEQGLDDGSRVKAEGEKGHYSMPAKRGTLSGKNPSDPIHFSMKDRPGGGSVMSGAGTARTLRWDGEAQTITLEGDVHAEGPRGELRAETAVYDAAREQVDLDGRRPVFLAREPGWSAAVQADHVSTVRRPAGRFLVSGDGGAHGWIYFPGSERWREGH
jgi:lipopolysaccharide export system protein LptA